MGAFQKFPYELLVMIGDHLNKSLVFQRKAFLENKDNLEDLLNDNNVFYEDQSAYQTLSQLTDQTQNVLGHLVSSLYERRIMNVADSNFDLVSTLCLLSREDEYEILKKFNRYTFPHLSRLIIGNKATSRIWKKVITEISVDKDWDIKITLVLTECIKKIEFPGWFSDKVDHVVVCSNVGIDVDEGSIQEFKNVEVLHYLSFPEEYINTDGLFSALRLFKDIVRSSRRALKAIMIDPMEFNKTVQYQFYADHLLQFYGNAKYIENIRSCVNLQKLHVVVTEETKLIETGVWMVNVTDLAISVLVEKGIVSYEKTVKSVIKLCPRSYSLKLNSFNTEENVIKITEFFQNDRLGKVELNLRPLTGFYFKNKSCLYSDCYDPRNINHILRVLAIEQISRGLPAKWLRILMINIYQNKMDIDAPVLYMLGYCQFAQSLVLVGSDVSIHDILMTYQDFTDSDFYCVYAPKSATRHDTFQTANDDIPGISDITIYKTRRKLSYQDRLDFAGYSKSYKRTAKEAQEEDILASVLGTCPNMKSRIYSSNRAFTISLVEIHRIAFENRNFLRDPDLELRRLRLY